MTTVDSAPHRGLDNAYGDLKERRERMDAKYDPVAAEGILNWIEGVIGEKFEDKSDFHACLKDGKVLCKLMNALKPGAIPSIYSGNLSFKQMENIGKFLFALPPYGIRSEDLFETPDLYEKTNLASVLVTLGQLQRVSGLHAKGVEVAAQKVRESPCLKRGKTDLDLLNITDKQWKNTGSTQSKYDHSGKDIANASGMAEDGLYGDMATRKQMLDMKYSKAAEEGIRNWIEGLTGEKIGDDFQAGLKSGVILLKVMQKLGSQVKINVKKMPFAERENIDNFLQAAEAFGILSSDKFQVVDLYEAGNMSQVLITLGALKRKAEGH